MAKLTALALTVALAGGCAPLAEEEDAGTIDTDGNTGGDDSGVDDTSDPGTDDSGATPAGPEWVEVTFNQQGTCWMGDGQGQSPPTWWGDHLPLPTPEDENPSYGFSCRDGGRPTEWIGRLVESTCPGGGIPGSLGWDETVPEAYCFLLYAP